MLHLHFEVTDSTTAHLKHARKICLSSWVFFVCLFFVSEKKKKKGPLRCFLFEFNLTLFNAKGIMNLFLQH